ncbi:MAG: type II toxin-antitoxin system PemK/MazF family toxin [Lentisphaerae bacterium]|jgi:mRNA interferase MazF|nr:type II toxin-antitoxin system PemK/MazF family toxin [Lentisphaerota bacterium]MBT4817102.1 type II toxin-antitoxin system PemK/MazF family toxin [Lentisphaerota bacterium]MBT5613025.1 type II toxin-antitoxin system PemK/MazF family toxin [Lentisphaerota bacterium]MBT7056729.1 type II toxin-antitoxin system PemK/MazF family toxin [Lentisphaerota bacterium]MBT7843753.1 type II toxin-antitoxin system PemK/MazF family toxin [Lentisphaerota bacterium]
MTERGEIWWADLGEPRGSEPGLRRPVLVVQADTYNRSNLATVIVLSLTTNKRLGDMPGNVGLAKADSGLRADSVINVTQLTTIDRSWLDGRVGRVPDVIMDEVAYGLGQVLGLD